MKYRPLMVLISVWFIAVFCLAGLGLFKLRWGNAPAGVGLAFALPLLAFAGVFFFSRPVRNHLSGLSPVLLVSLHGWRFVGLGFVMAYYRGLLPPAFAWPAGLGDIAAAAAAPYLAYSLSEDKEWIRSRWFLAWNIFGLVDLLSAVGLGVAHQMAPHFFHASVSTGLMQEMPFVLIPCYFVPLLVMTHLVMLDQSAQVSQRGFSEEAIPRATGGRLAGA